MFPLTVFTPVSCISLCGLCLVAFLSELNNLELWATDIGNAYLEAYTGEKVYIIANPEFGDREPKATSLLYGRHSTAYVLVD